MRRHGRATASLWLACVAAVTLASSGDSRAEEDRGALHAVESLDLDRYAGRWFEVARLPNRFQDQCVGDVVVFYEPAEDGRLSVRNSCRLEDGTWTTAEGTARPAKDDTEEARFEVRFAPRWLSFLPFVWGDYWVLDLDPGYRYALIGEPDREYLWVLSREPEMDAATIDRLLARAEALGYDVGPVVRTSNTGALPPG